MSRLAIERVARIIFRKQKTKITIAKVRADHSRIKRLDCESFSRLSVVCLRQRPRPSKSCRENIDTECQAGLSTQDFFGEDIKRCRLLTWRRTSGEAFKVWPKNCLQFSGLSNDAA
jgi:hypothetical protein